MKNLETMLIPVLLGLVGSTGGLAAFAVGNLVVEGPRALHQNAPTAPAVAAPATAEADAAATPVTLAAPTQTAADAAPAKGEGKVVLASASVTTDAPVTPAPITAEPATAPAPVVLAAATTPAAAAAASSGGDAAAGETVFKKCATCHSVDKGGKAKTGPNLWGIVGAPVAHAEGFKYSDAMKAHGGTWTPEALDAYLAKPKDAVPGNKMSFAGLSKAEDRSNVIAFLSAQSDDAPAAPAAAAPAATETTAAPAEPPAAQPAATETAAADAAAPAADAPADAAPDAAPAAIAEPVQIPHVDPPEPGADEIAAIAEKVAAITARLPQMDYQRARFDKIHFPPQIATASNAECLVCHQEITDHKVRETSPAGIKATEALAWYQTLDTYLPQDGTGQSDFHWRHLDSPLAQKVMNLQCTFCHKGNDPREESPNMMPGRAAFTADVQKPEFTARKMVNPSETCLRCHGQMPNPTEIMGLPGHWPEIRADMEDQTSDEPTSANGCLSCHAETFRTNRHNVTYLKAAGIEDLAQAGSDTCYGCHGGRAWYRNSYPYPRHPWPGMDPATPDWAKDRPTESDPEYRMPATASATTANPTPDAAPAAPASN